MPSVSPLVVIPARMGSSRLPGKPLADISGQPMIVHVWRRCVDAQVGSVVVACSEEEVRRAVQEAGGAAVMTDPALPSGSDRVWAALQQYDPHGVHQVVINVQGDLPTLDPSLVRAALEPLENPAVDIATLVAPIKDEAEADNPNVVKAVAAFSLDQRTARALYFSRARVPAGSGPCWHHIGLYAYRREALERFVSLSPSILEIRESLEQLRALEDGLRIDCVRVDTVPLGVDAPEDLERARQLLRGAE
ncbi:3-deoxy-manno-octulosonate cytidylyltransferase [Microvirga roseola]|uniref:3-deoxy-manno-octulosonate cytidylyltransferase n=1 Tax=Microvirga roseola TaxID=2883126 RepID=UPI001E5C2AD3|nr:3-deoxy-manno-octulosonate cytidylyltransferase [Microvirga roseola]